MRNFLNICAKLRELLSYRMDLAEHIRDMRQGPDGSLYLLTNDANGRIIIKLERAGE